MNHWLWLSFLSVRVLIGFPITMPFRFCSGSAVSEKPRLLHSFQLVFVFHDSKVCAFRTQTYVNNYYTDNVVNNTYHLANITRWPNVGLLFGQRRRRWVNYKPTLGQRLMFAGLFANSKRHISENNNYLLLLSGLVVFNKFIYYFSSKTILNDNNIIVDSWNIVANLRIP